MKLEGWRCPWRGQSREQLLGQGCRGCSRWGGCLSLLSLLWHWWWLQGDRRVGRAAASSGGEGLTLFLTPMVQPRAPGLVTLLEEADRQKGQNMGSSRVLWTWAHPDVPWGSGAHTHPFAGSGVHPDAPWGSRTHKYPSAGSGHLPLFLLLNSKFYLCSCHQG